MAGIIKRDVLDCAPELVRITNETPWVIFLGLANRLDSRGLGNDTDLIKACRVLLVAHYLTALKRGASGAAGPVTSEAVGAVRRSFGLVALASSDAALGSTSYGQQFMGLVGMSAAAGPQLVR